MGVKPTESVTKGGPVRWAPLCGIFPRKEQNIIFHACRLVGHAPRMQAMCWVAMAGKIYNVGGLADVMRVVHLFFFTLMS